MLYAQAAGIAKPMSDVNPSIAEEALEELKNRITSLEMEQENLKFKVCLYILVVCVVNSNAKISNVIL